MQPFGNLQISRKEHYSELEILWNQVRVRINKIWVITDSLSSIIKCGLRETQGLQTNKFINTLNNLFTTE